MANKQADHRSRILYYSDCPFFAGSENMIANFSASEGLRSDASILLLHRRNPVYTRGLRQRACFSMDEVYSLWLYHANPGMKYSKPIIRLIWRLLALVGRHLFFWADVVLLWRYIRRIRPDLVHINNGGLPGAMTCTAAALAARLCGVRSIVYVVNNLAVPYRSFSRFVDWPLERFLIASVSLFVNGSAYASLRLGQVLRIGKGHRLCLPNGIKPRVVTRSRAEVRAEWAISEECLVIGSIALLEWRKGHSILLDAFRRVIDKLPSGKQVHLIIEGFGPEAENLHQQAKALGITDWVSFIGRAEYVFDCYQAFDIYAFSSLSNEDFPNVILESMSQGLPVVATRVAGVPEQIVDNESGLLVPPGDSESLAIALLKVILNGELRKCIGKEAKARFEKLFTHTVAVERYRDLYRALVNFPDRLLWRIK